MKRLRFVGISVVSVVLLFSACKKDNVSPDSLYVPTASDVTANASLAELQQGHSVYLSNCSACHGLYSPDNFSSLSWKSILSRMAPKAGLSSSESALVLKYVSRGK
jgi:mono/diheme cytochrome c family protein